MKLRNLFLLVGLAVTFTPIYAGSQGCEKDTVHCAYIGGLIEQEYGRYVKVTYKNSSFIDCFSASDTLEVLPGYGQEFVGTNSIAFHICNSMTDEKCQPLGEDNFTVSQAGDQYIATPRFYNINLSVVQAKYAKCQPYSIRKSLLP